MFREFDPSIIQLCFQPWYFNKTASAEVVPTTWEMYQNPTCFITSGNVFYLRFLRIDYEMSFLNNKFFSQGNDETSSEPVGSCDRFYLLRSSYRGKDYA